MQRLIHEFVFGFRLPIEGCWGFGYAGYGIEDGDEGEGGKDDSGYGLRGLEHWLKIARLMFNAKILLGGDGLSGHYVLAFLSTRWGIVLRLIVWLSNHNFTRLSIYLLV